MKARRITEIGWMQRMKKISMDCLQIASILMTEKKLWLRPVTVMQSKTVHRAAFVLLFSCFVLFFSFFVLFSWVDTIVFLQPMCAQVAKSLNLCNYLIFCAFERDIQAESTVAYSIARLLISAACSDHPRSLVRQLATMIFGRCKMSKRKQNHFQVERSFFFQVECQPK